MAADNDATFAAAAVDVRWAVGRVEKAFKTAVRRLLTVVVVGVEVSEDEGEGEDEDEDEDEDEVESSLNCWSRR